MRVRGWLSVVLLGASAVWTVGAHAQPCGPTGGWIPTFDGGLDGRAAAMVVMPNGDVVVAGGFTTAGGQPAGRLARWNGVEWTAMADITDPFSGLLSLALLPNGDLLVGGGFTVIGGVPANNIARFDGTSWHAIGNGLNEGITCIQPMPNGDILAGGWFANIPGATGLSRGLARWDGTQWTSPGNVVGSIACMTLMTNGELVVGGSFGSVGGVPANNVARWNGTAWAPLDAGTLGFVHTVCGLNNGGVAVGGSFARAGNFQLVNFIAQWRASTGWTTMGNGVEGDVFSITRGPGNELLVGGRFLHAAPATSRFVALWNGSTWTALGVGTDQFCFSGAFLPASRGSEIIVGGQFMSAGGDPANGFARYSRSGQPWVALHPSVDGWTCGRGSVELRTAPAVGYRNIEFLWRRNGAPLKDGTTPWGSTIEGALTGRLVITSAGEADAGSYDCVIGNVCGIAVSGAATVQVCRADFDCDHATDSRDFFAYVLAFFQGHPSADMTGDTKVAAEDFFQYVELFFAGC